MAVAPTGLLLRETIMLGQQRPHTVRPRDSLHVVPAGLTGRGSIKVFRAAARRLVTWCADNGDPAFGRSMLLKWRASLVSDGLAPNTVNVYVSMIRSWVQELQAAGEIDLVTTHAINSVGGIPRRGQRNGRWLDAADARRLIEAAGDDLVGVRDRAIIAVMLGGGLRRAEVSSLDVQQFRRLEGRAALVNIEGKGGKVRTVPLPEWAAELITEWLDCLEYDSGPMFVNMTGTPQHEDDLRLQRLGPAGVCYAVTRAADAVDLNVRPHDLRRTFAKLAYKGGAPLDQLQLVLGHSSIQTTEKYLGLGLDTTQAPGDYIQISLSGKNGSTPH